MEQDNNLPQIRYESLTDRLSRLRQRIDPLTGLQENDPASVYQLSAIKDSKSFFTKRAKNIPIDYMPTMKMKSVSSLKQSKMIKNNSLQNLIVNNQISPPENNPINDSKSRKPGQLKRISSQRLHLTEIEDQENFYSGQDCLKLFSEQKILNSRNLIDEKRNIPRNKINYDNGRIKRVKLDLQDFDGMWFRYQPPGGIVSHAGAIKKNKNNQFQRSQGRIVRNSNQWYS